MPLLLPRFLLLLVLARARPCEGADSLSVLRRWDPGYAEAGEFAEFLSAHGLPPRCVTRSVLQGFLGDAKAAGFQTDSGPLAVVFFPEPAGAESVHVVERIRGGRYHYTFTTRQRGLLSRTTWDLDAPARILVRGTWFIVAWEERLESWLRQSIPAPPRLRSR